MKRIAIILILLLILLLTSPSYGVVIFTDDFSSGDFSKTMNGFSWGSAGSVGSSNASVSGGQAFVNYPGSSPCGDAAGQLAFDLGGLYQELWIQYDEYIPTNYEHRTSYNIGCSSSVSNNKQFRIWDSNDYSLNPDKVGASVWRNDGDSNYRIDWNEQDNGIGPKSYDLDDPDFLTSADIGTTITIKLHLKQATSSEYGLIEVYKNNVKVASATAVNNYTSGGDHAFRYGYLLGWANSGYDELTSFGIDNVIFATSESDLAGTSTMTWYQDIDGDGYHAGVTQSAETDPGATWYTLGDLLGGGDIDDNDATVNPTTTNSYLAFSAATGTADRADGYAYADIVRTNNSTGEVTVEWMTLSDTATYDTDYVGSNSNVVTFVDGDTVETIQVPIYDNGATEDRGFEIILSDPSVGAALGTIDTIYMTILGTNSEPPSPGNKNAFSFGSGAVLVNGSGEAYITGD